MEAGHPHGSDSLPGSSRACGLPALRLPPAALTFRTAVDTSVTIVIFSPTRSCSSRKPQVTLLDLGWRGTFWYREERRVPRMTPSFS